jgi:hypothetical protein
MADTNTLIANTGIQILKTDFKIPARLNNFGNIGFYERLDLEAEKIILEYASYLPEDDVWVPKNQLKREGYFPNNIIAEDINLSRLTVLDEESQTYKISNIDNILSKIENKWIPLPYFKKSNFGITLLGPTNWARLKLIQLGSAEGAKSYRCILSFDTKTQEDNKEYPRNLDENEKAEYQLCKDEDLLLKYCDDEDNFRWISEYLKEAFCSNGLVKFPMIKYLAEYIYLVKFLENGDLLPEVILCSDKGDNYINVDLVTDVGNTNTSAILFENHKGNTSFKFDKVKSLVLNDLTSHEYSYSNDFSTRLAFSRADFGEMYTGDKKFQWPSILRLGNEAQRLINESELINPFGSETVTNYSSPKRYLWDHNLSERQWEYIRTKENKDLEYDGIFVEGISQQFKKDGSFTNIPEHQGISTNFSRQSLMTFTFIEIFSHALSQINSVTFRKEHGEFDKLRKLNRVIVTCPTAMVQNEQVQLRKSAEDAALALQRFFNDSFQVEFDFKTNDKTTSVIPSSKNVAMSLNQVNDRKDWLYDESTCCQLVFLYSEISKRYLNKADKFFNLYGKSDKDESTLTIGSIDIGGGTSDLMVCKYTYQGSGTTVLTPEPLYWESFNLAGDELLKEVIRNIIIEGDNSSSEICAGHIKHFGSRSGIPDMVERINNFFGSNTSGINYETRQFRKNFNVQISIPIANKLLEHGANNDPDHELYYEDIFTNNSPSQDLLKFFSKHFGFEFERIVWKFNRKTINSIISYKFEDLINQVSALFHLYKCDFVLLAGKPTSLKHLQNLFVKNLPVYPNRIVPLSSYRVGRWYPFSDANGNFLKQKSIVAVGALISQMASNSDKLSGFRLNLDNLKTKIISTADIVGVYNVQTNELDSVLLDSKTSNADIEISALPVAFGFKKINASAYPARPFYQLTFNDKKIEEKVRAKNSDNKSADIQALVDIFKTRFKIKMPITIAIVRNFNENKEVLEIVSIRDKENEEISQSYFELVPKTIKDEDSYWLDSGIFQLGIRN